MERRGPGRDVDALLDRITGHTATVSVLGQGYVGLSVAAGAALTGMTAYGVDVDDARAAALAAGDNVVPGVDDALFRTAYDTGRLRVGTDPSVVAAADVVLVCVPTPIADSRPDLSMIEAAGRTIAAHLTPGALVVLESTTYPGTTEQVLLPLLEASGLVAGEDFLLAYSPERIDPGNTDYGLRNTPRVVGGLDGPSSKAAVAFYGQLVDDVVEVGDLRAAEMAKLLENTFRAVNIALVNEFAQLCGEQGIDTWDVIRAASSKPFGFMPFHPGPGVGGHCIPLDPTYLAWQSRRDTGRPFRLVEMAQDINAQMPAYVAGRVIDALNDRDLSVRGASVLALGVTYKPDVGDMRESAAVEVVEHLVRRGATLSFHDPYVERLDAHGLTLERTDLSDAVLEAADCVLLLTPHSSYDVDALVERSRFLFDVRNAAGSRDRPSVETL